MSAADSAFNVEKIRKDFPILERMVHENTRLIYLDSAATSQKPVQVISVIDEYYLMHNANIHRGVHTLAEEATASYEDARARIAKFINASSSNELIYTRNTTESINLVANTWARQELISGDLIVLTEMEHHSNLVPWQMLAKEKDLRLEFIPVLDDGTLDQEAFRRLLKLNPRLVAFTHMSNVLGTINPAREMIKAAHDAGALVLLDGAQSVPHFKVDVRDLDVDFMAFSAHKMLGPTGIGALYGKKVLLEAMPPFMGGGDMIRQVKLRTFLPNSLPHKFEAGTPSISEGIAFGAAVDYLTEVGIDQIARYEEELITYALERLQEVAGVKVLGPSADKKGGVAAFTLDGVHPHDVAQILDSVGIAVRAGHHCAMPLHERFQIPASSRASFYLYNTRQEIDQLVEGLKKVKAIFSA